MKDEQEIGGKGNDGGLAKGGMMQHYQKNVTGILKYCPTCGKMTMHRVDDCRVSTCTEPHVHGMSKAQIKAAKKREKLEGQVDMFDRRTP